MANKDQSFPVWTSDSDSGMIQGVDCDLNHRGRTAGGEKEQAGRLFNSEAEGHWRDARATTEGH